MMVTDRQTKSSHLTVRPGIIRLSRSAGTHDGAAYPQPRSAKPALWHLRMPSRSRFVPVQHPVVLSPNRARVRIRTWAAKTNQRLDSHAKAPRLSFSRALTTLLRALLRFSRILSWQRSATEALFEKNARNTGSSAVRSRSIRLFGYKTWLENCQEKTVERISGQFFFTSSCANSQGREECSRC